MNFKQWLGENWGREDDPSSIEARPGAVVYKWIIPLVTQDDHDRDTHRMGEVERSLKWRKGDGKDGDFKHNPDGYKPGSGGTPPIKPGYWQSHAIFKMTDDEMQVKDSWGREMSTYDRANRYRQNDMGQAHEAAREVVKSDPDVFASVVLHVAPHNRAAHESDPTTTSAYYIATSQTKDGKKNITTIKPKNGYQQDVGEQIKQVNNTLWKQIEAFGFDQSQYKGFHVAKHSRVKETMHDELFGMQYRSWQWNLVLTPEGWRANGSKSSSRTMGRRMYAGSTIQDHEHYISVTVHWDGKNWAVDDTSTPEANQSGFDRMLSHRFRRETMGRNVSRPTINQNQGADVTAGAETFDQAITRLCNEVPWIKNNRWLQKVANPYRVSPQKWNSMVEEAIVRAIDDDQYAKPTRQKPQGE